jgi:ElaB/YqjD/DUF883 family membrane-anchored ribosome-binding protein
MNKQIQAERTETGTLADDAQALLNATADVGGERVEEARKRLASALERCREICGKVREKVVEGAKATDAAVHKHPYQAIGVALGVGALLGYVVALRRCRNHD